MKKKIEYYALLSESGSPGVEKKIAGIKRGFEGNGYSCEAKIFFGSSLACYPRIFGELVKSSASIIIVRYKWSSMWLLSPVFLFKRILGKKIILENPSPLVSVAREISSLPVAKWKKILLRTSLYLFHPIALISATTVIQYSNESSYFLLGLRKKTKLITNGVEITTAPSFAPPAFSSPLIFIGVAKLAAHHGYDRMLASIARHNRVQKIKVHFHIVGDGPYQENLERAASSCLHPDEYCFHGRVEGKALARLYESSHLGVCSLGLYRKGIILASELKAREYCCSGIPFISCAEDLDFPDSFPFRFLVENSEELISIQNILDWYFQLRASVPKFGGEMRSYAREKLSYEEKVVRDYL